MRVVEGVLLWVVYTLITYHTYIDRIYPEAMQMKKADAHDDIYTSNNILDLWMSPERVVPLWKRRLAGLL